MNTYEKKYKEALSKAKDMLSYKEVRREDMEYLFPELAESEDEKIRNEIIQFLQLPHPQFVGKRNHAEWIAWLEKQGEQKEIDYNEELKKCKDNPLYFFDKYVKIKLKEQKPVWSEEDEKKCQETIGWFEKRCFPYALEHENPARESIKWLKSLKERINHEQNSNNPRTKP